MKGTIYHNASGLPAREQNRTTARDLSILARALYRDFPQDYRYFATRQFAYHGSVFSNHNHLMSSFQGMDGIKTGFINASGFNLAASAVRDNRRLIGVVMGGESARGRDARMAQLLNQAFAQSGPRIMTAKAEATEAVPETLAEASAVAAAPVPEKSIAGRAVAAISPIGRAEAAPIARKTAPAASEQVAERWAIQLGAFSQQATAEKAARTTLAKLPMAKHKPIQVLAPEKTDKERLYRVRVVNFTTRHEADQACSVLHRKHEKCAVVAPTSTRVARS
jgi:D-alanyl-D-alanine carboxypeptidase